MVRFGIVGFGRHAVKRLMPGFARARDCRVTALSRRDPVKARESAREYKIPLAFSTTEDLCRSSEVDAVLVTSPDSQHLPDVLTALKYGKAVLCEKPMAMNADECRQMIAAAKEARQLLGVAHVFRFEHTLQRARAIVESGELGSITHARLEFHYWGMDHGRSWINDPKVACGGPIGDVGVHCIDALRFIFQDDVIRVTTTAREDEKSHPFECAAIMNLEFRAGLLATIVVSTRAQYRTPLEIVGTKGILRAQDAMTVDAPVVMDTTNTATNQTRREDLLNNDAYTLQVDAFAAAVRGTGVFPCLGEEGLKNQLILAAAYRSWKSGRSESLSS